MSGRGLGCDLRLVLVLTAQSEVKPKEATWGPDCLKIELFLLMSKRAEPVLPVLGRR